MKAIQVSALLACLCVAIEAFPFGGMFPGGMFNRHLGPWGPRYPYRRPSPYRQVRPRPAMETTTTTTTTTTTQAPMVTMPPHKPYMPAHPYPEPELYVYDGGYNDGYNNGYDSHIIHPAYGKNAGSTNWNGQTIVVIQEDHPTPNGRQAGSPAQRMNTQAVQTGAVPQMMNTQGVQSQMINNQQVRRVTLDQSATGNQKFVEVTQGAGPASAGAFQASAQLPVEQFNTQTQLIVETAAKPTHASVAPAVSKSAASTSSGTQNPAAEPRAEPTNQMDAMVRNYILSEMEHVVPYDAPTVGGQTGKVAGLDLKTLQRMHMYEALDLPTYAAFQSGPAGAAADAVALQASL